MEENMSNENITFEELLNDSLNKNKKLGKVAEGKVISINNKGEIFVDLNYKADGIVPKSEFSFNENENPKDFFKPGDSITCEVLKLNDGEGNVLLSYKRYKSKIEKEKFEEKINNDDIFEEKVSDINSNGAIVNCYGSRVFIPISLLGGTNNAVEKGSIVRFKIIEYNPKEHKIIGSCKKVLEEEKNKKEQEFWDNAEIGKEYITDPITIPQKPYMPASSPMNFDSHPFDPRIIINPMPCEIDGISIGTVSNVLNSVLRLIFVLATAHDNKPARETEISVAVELTTIDCLKALENFAVFITAITSTDAIVAIILASGNTIAIAQKTQSSTFSAVDGFHFLVCKPTLFIYYASTYRHQLLRIESNYLSLCLYYQ